MTLLAVLLLAAVAPAGRADPAAKSRATERRLEREVRSDAAWYRVSHSFGEVRVLAAAPNEEPHARLDLSASGVGADAERRYLEEVQLEIADATEPASGAPDPEKPRVVLVRTVFPDKQRQPPGLSFAATLTLWLPETAAVDVANSFGRAVVEGRTGRVKVVCTPLGAIEVRRVIGEIDLENQFDEVVVADVEGAVTVRGKSSPVTIERARGPVDVRTNGAIVRVDGADSAYVENRLKPVDVRNVKGDATIIAPFCGVTVRDVGGTLKVTSSNGSVSIEGVGKDLTVEHKTGKVEARRIRGNATVMGNLSDITLAGVGGNADVHGPSAPVTVEGVTGRLVVENSARTLELADPRGDVEASAHGGLLKIRWPAWPPVRRGPPDTTLPPPRSITLIGEVGGIEIELPDDAAVLLDVTSTVGRIDCELPGMSFAQAGAARTGMLELGPGPRERKAQLHATCVGGAIRVRRAGAR